MSSIVNIAAYQFVPLDGLQELRARLLEKCRVWELRGTILLSPEGINLFVAGGEAEIDLLLSELRKVPGLERLTPKVSISESQPFRRMLVRIKREIIAFGVEGIEPGRQTSPKLAPRELKQWLDEGRPVTLLDTRNEYEVRVGTFDNAKTLGIDHFRDFPAAVTKLPEEMKEQPIVMFCTGGIRCEKAGPFMEREGFRQIFQLDGGILKYFEECGGEHYTGECFVFDQRVGVDARLAETEIEQCFRCMSPLSLGDQQDERYVPGVSCPFCYVTDGERLRQTLAERHAAIGRITTPLPGSVPYDQDRPMKIPAKCEGMRLVDALIQILPHLGAEYWAEKFAKGLVLTSGGDPADEARIVRAGERYLNRTPALAEPAVSAEIRILHEDEAIVVVDKPAPLPLHPSGRFHRNSLQWILNEVYAPQKLRPVHRLDANTTGVVVFARTRQYAGRLQPLFAMGEVEKVYVARIAGHPPEDRFSCDAPISTDRTEFGGRAVDEQGLAARTEFRGLLRHEDGTSLVEARPLTGRTNQIRVHLWHLGWPIVGDQSYLGNHQLGATQTHELDAPSLCLHAWRIEFSHPLTHERVTFEAELPMWANGDVPAVNQR